MYDPSPLSWAVDQVVQQDHLGDRHGRASGAGVDGAEACGHVGARIPQRMPNDFFGGRVLLRRGVTMDMQAVDWPAVGVSFEPKVGGSGNSGARIAARSGWRIVGRNSTSAESGVSGGSSRDAIRPNLHHDVGMCALRLDESDVLGFAGFDLSGHLIGSLPAKSGVAFHPPLASDVLCRIEEDGDVEAGTRQPAVQWQHAVDNDEVVGLHQFWMNKPSARMIVYRLENGLTGRQQLQMLFEDLDVAAVGMQRCECLVLPFLSVEPLIVIGGHPCTSVRPEASTSPEVMVVLPAALSPAIASMIGRRPLRAARPMRMFFSGKLFTHPSLRPGRAR